MLEEVIFTEDNGVGIITLNRPDRLNALTYSMVQKINKNLNSWEISEKINCVIIEGAGGWAVPITSDYYVGDLATELCSDVLIVVDNKLGALNKTILTANAIRDKGLHLAGIILNHVEVERDTASISNRSILEGTINPPFIIDILHDETSIEYPFNSI